jgi:hypothetical protein
MGRKVEGGQRNEEEGTRGSAETGRAVLQQQAEPS